ncbi:Glycosyltransferase involved in cell wall bisynthesis [Clostridium cavendishii DSM 21758]|uniref:Glycosyltransferase involved in cell wall bisynthesis n=1 Tax=Clostridium cavendishii DSM 21758 TaxID=1121302 RepID=A0A1M6U781_9CLOT|nr:glycosyltransferase family 1 protein [Clostridium cavendishii]SHK65023.1 Glycosyltransferase involved in cell wall bisynthesis [Clostridium cavendishii DSM 21758]
MKISIDGRAAKWYRGTGIGTYTYQLINNLNQIDFLNDYLVFLPENSNIENNLHKNFDISLVKDGISENFWEQVRVPNILKDESADIYHVPQNGVGLSNKVSCKKVITLHDIIPLRMPETVSHRYLKIFNEEMPNILDSTSGIITVSEFSKQDIAKQFNYPLENIFVTHLAAEEVYTPLNKIHSKEYLKKKYGISDDFILYVGGFSPRKNILGLIEAFSILVKSHKSPINLVILGKQGPSYDKYKTRTLELNISDKVIFPGFIELNDMPIFYNASRLFVYPSFYEGFGLPPVEAMASGTPVIASNLTSVPEILGDSALLINPSSVDEIKNSMLNILEDKVLTLNLINKGFIHSSKYSWKKTAYDTLDAYKSICNLT